MSWIATLLIGIAVADLTHSVKAIRVVPECCGAGTVVLLGLFAGLTDTTDVIALLAIAIAVIAWGQSVTWGFGTGRTWLPLLVLGACLVLVVVFSGQASPVAGPLVDWLAGVPLPVLHDLDADRALLLLGAFGVQMSTGNVIVRLVLAATGTVNPARGSSHDATRTLKGGRLLGPMERLFIVGLGIAGHATAASIVIAAKGLLRFPELQSRRDALEGPGIDEVTEYFLVGSFVSWLVALGSLVLLSG